MNRYQTVTRIVVDIIGTYEAEDEVEAHKRATVDALASVAVDPARSEVEAAEWEAAEVTVTLA